LLLDVVLAENLVDFEKSSWLVLVGVGDTDVQVRLGDDAEVDFGEGDTAGGATSVEVACESRADFYADETLGLFGGTAW
jgi:hypothetical protein